MTTFQPMVSYTSILDIYWVAVMTNFLLLYVIQIWHAASMQHSKKKKIDPAVLRPQCTEIFFPTLTFNLTIQDK